MSKTLKLGLSWASGTVPGSLILRNILHGVRILGFWDSSNVLLLSQVFGSLRLRNILHGVGTLGLWDSPNIPGLSQASATVPRPRTVPVFWVSEIEKYTPWCWDSGSLGQSQSPGTVPNLKILYLLSRHHIIIHTYRYIYIYI